MGKTSGDPWPASARMVVALLVMAIGLTLITSAIGFARATSAIHRIDKVSTSARADTKCNSDWKKAYRAAQKPRLKAQKANLESQLRFYRSIDRLTTGSIDASPAAQAARRDVLHKAIKAAYDDTAAQLDAQDNNSYPQHKCGGSETTQKPKASRPSLAPKKGSDHAKTGSATVDGSGGSGQSRSGTDGTVGVGGGPATGGHRGGGGDGGSTGNPGSGSPGGGGGGTQGAPDLVGDLLTPICGLLRVVGCGSQ